MNARRLVDDAGGAQNDAAADAAKEAFVVLDEINRPIAELDAACELRNDRPMPISRSRRAPVERLEPIDDAPIDDAPIEQSRRNAPPTDRDERASDTRPRDAHHWR